MVIQIFEAGILLLSLFVPELLTSMLFHPKKPQLSEGIERRSVILVRAGKGGQLTPLGTLGNSSLHLPSIFALVISRKGSYRRGPKLKPYSNNLVPTLPTLKRQRTTGRAMSGWEKPGHKALSSSLFPGLRFSARQGRKEGDSKEDKAAVMSVTCQLRILPCMGNSLLACPILSGLCVIWAARRGQPQNLLSKLTQWITRITITQHRDRDAMN